MKYPSLLTLILAEKIRAKIGQKPLNCSNC